MPLNNEPSFELTKMPVLPNLRGQKIEQHLLVHCIQYAKTNTFDRLLLYSDTKL